MPYGSWLLPTGIVESGRIPARLFQPSIIRLAHQEVLLDDRPSRSLPVAIGANHLVGAVGVLQIDLHAHCGTVAVVAALLAEADVTRIPPVAQHRSDHV